MMKNRRYLLVGGGPGSSVIPIEHKQVLVAESATVVREVDVYQTLAGIFKGFKPCTIFMNELDSAKFEFTYMQRRYGKRSISCMLAKRHYKKLKKGKSFNRR